MPTVLAKQKCTSDLISRRIPPFDRSGDMPPGIHRTSLQEFIDRFDTNQQRHRLVSGLLEAMNLLRRAGCRAIYVGGSLVTSKDSPDDFDACWDSEGVSLTFLYHLEPALVGSLQEQRARFGGELVRSEAITAFSAKTFLCFLQTDRNNKARGIIAIDLEKL